MGWGGGGLNPTPSNTHARSIPKNFQGEMESIYQFTISDALVKTCTNTYSGYTQGKQYLSYKDFMIGWGYESTGELGTDIIMSDFRMYDITNGYGSTTNLFKNGTFSAIDIIETTVNDFSSVNKQGGLSSPQIIEI